MSIELIQHFWQAEDGQDLVEYSLLLALIALAAVAMLSQTGGVISKMWNNISTNLGTTANSIN